MHARASPTGSTERITTTNGKIAAHANPAMRILRPAGGT